MGYRHLDFIPLNPIAAASSGSQGPITSQTVFTRSREEDMQEFMRRLNDRGIPTTIRDTRGSDIDAACGQLAALE